MFNLFSFNIFNFMLNLTQKLYITTERVNNVTMIFVGEPLIVFVSIARQASLALRPCTTSYTLSSITS